MDLIRDCLDKQLTDRHGRKMGKVDGIIIELEEGQQPRVAYLEVGAVTQARRLHPRLGRWAKEIARRWGRMPHDPFRIPWSKVVVSGIDVTIGVEAEKTPALAWELWLRRKIIGRIPGA